MTDFDGTCGTCDFNYRSCYCNIDDNAIGLGKERKCTCPTERRAAIIAQLSAEDREALEFGCRMNAKPADVMLNDTGTEWFAMKRGYSIGRGKTPLEALRAAHVGDGWEKEG